MLVPYSTYQVVAVPFGFTLPETVAVVGPIAVTGPVVAVGGDAAAAPPAPTRAATATAANARGGLHILWRVLPVESGAWRPGVATLPIFYMAGMWATTVISTIIPATSSAPTVVRTGRGSGKCVA